MKKFILPALLLLSMVSSAQTFEEKIVASLDSFSLANPQEKIYLQTDRSKYIAGETIWFKAYNTLFEKPGILSKVLYVTLSDAGGAVLLKKQLKLNNGSAAGELELPPAFNAGEYIISAYTLWSLNFPQYTFRKPLVVYNNSQESASAPAAGAGKLIKLQFYPEGGQLVAGVPSAVAFKISDEYGHGKTITGSIVNSKNTKVADLKPLSAGMGSFSFTPEAGETYAGVITNGNANVKYPLPAVLPEGINLEADNSNSSKTFIRLQRGEKNKEGYNELLLVAQQHYQVVYMAKINFDEGQDAVAINKKNLRPGIMQITVFNPRGDVLASRAVFVNSNDVIPALDVKATTAKRGKNTVTVDLAAYSAPDISAAVVNAEAMDNSPEQNIQSTLLLCSDLPGYLPAAANYLAEKDSQGIRKLDLLMQVQGWTRFNWADVLAYRFPALKYPFETGLSITGKVLQSNNKTGLSAGKINLVIKGEDSTTIMSEATLSPNADFVVADLEFKKSASIYYQGTNTKNTGAIVSVKMNDGYFDTLRKLAVFPIQALFPAETPLPPYLQKLLTKKQTDDESRSKLLQDVRVFSKRPSLIDSMHNLYVSPVFEYSDQTLIMDDGHYFDIWQYLQRMVPGIAIDKTEATPRVNFTRYDGLSFFSSDGPTSGVQLFLNEVPISPEIADNLNPSDISMVKVYKGVTGIALGVNRGAIGFYTKKRGFYEGLAGERI